MVSNFTLQSLALYMFILLSFGFILYVGSSIFLPLSFATLIAIFLQPINQRMLRIFRFKTLSILITFLVVFLPLGIVAILFSSQLNSIVNSLPEINQNLRLGIDNALSAINEFIPVINFNKKDLIESSKMSNLENPISVISQGFIASSSLLISAALSIIYTFLLLYYQSSIENFIVFQFEKRLRSNVKETLFKIQKIVQGYIGGLGVVIIFLSVVNSIGLLLIGIQFPLFWGTLAGLLAVIPYIGTGLGGLLPFLFALATADHNWQPIAILVYYGIIQFLEGNVITPKIVGNKVNINPLFALLSLVILGTFWGAGGVILALPIIGIIRIIFSQFESTTPLAILMSSGVDQKTGKFKKWAES